MLFNLIGSSLYIVYRKFIYIYILFEYLYCVLLVLCDGYVDSAPLFTNCLDIL